MSDNRVEPKIRLPLPDGGSIVLVDMLEQGGSRDEVNRNVYRLGSDGAVIWRIGTDAQPGERQPYTNIYFKGGELRAYCWNGAEYPVDPDTGEIGRGELVR